MPLHFVELDVMSRLTGVGSVLIVPCQMCPAITVAVKEKKAFLKPFRHFLKSEPFDRYLQSLRSELQDRGMAAQIFHSRLPHQWFMCMWPPAQGRKLGRTAEHYDAVLVLGCDSAVETVRDAVSPMGKKVISGMAVSGIMNAAMEIRFPLNISFLCRRIVPISPQDKG